MAASQTVDVLVLGAGFVGVSAALQLQMRGRSVALVDRHATAAAETSFGNAGIIQSEAIYPYMFPRDPGEILRAALNLDPRVNIRYGALPSIAPFVWRYFRASTALGRERGARAMAGFIARAAEEHRAFAARAGSSALVREGGWIKIWRSPRGEDEVRREVEELKPWGIEPRTLDRAALSALEPHVGEMALGGAQFVEPLSTSDPQALAQSYADLLTTLGGRFVVGDAATLAQSGGLWTVSTRAGTLQARSAVVALGAWAKDVVERLGYRLPFGVKRGYHMHYAAKGNAGLTRPVLDLEKGYVLAPMARGLRLTTGAEFARRDDPPSAAHLDRVEPFARQMFPLAERLDPEPWMGRRPCLPDMAPMVGPAPRHKGLWFDFGHHHLGLTLGPVSGLLIAQMMDGEEPFVDPAPFRVDRFAYRGKARR